jgi:S-adenosylmethionine:tRNA ribosyltransferase-isomerase
MKAATRPEPAGLGTKLLWVDPTRPSTRATTLAELPELLNPSDVVVVNDAATQPASFFDRSRALEVRLVGHTAQPREYGAVLLGAGDYRTPTEERPPPGEVQSGDWLTLGHDLHARVQSFDRSTSSAILRFEYEPATLLERLYRAGKPIQYAHVPEPLELWDVQSRFATRAWAFEFASAGRALTGELLLSLARRNIEVVFLTHAAGVSATGNPRFEQLLPLAERYEIPEATAHSVNRARRRASRVLAVGTTVVRALECNVQEHGEVTAGPGLALGSIDGQHELHIVTGVLSGMHEPTTSHFQLLEAFADRAQLLDAIAMAERLDFRQHEFGDFCLVHPSVQ